MATRTDAYPDVAISPGEYLGTRGNEVRRAAKQVSPPTLVLAPVDEQFRRRGPAGKRARSSAAQSATDAGQDSVAL